MVSLKENKTIAMRERSGKFASKSKLIGFLYLLMRDHIPPGIVEEILNDCDTENTTVYTNGWLAQYAEDIANRLK